MRADLGMKLSIGILAVVTATGRTGARLPTHPQCLARRFSLRVLARTRRRQRAFEPPTKDDSSRKSLINPLISLISSIENYLRDIS